MGKPLNKYKYKNILEASVGYTNLAEFIVENILISATIIAIFH